MRGLALVTMGVAQHQGDVPPLGGLERIGRGRRGRSEHLAQPGHVEVGKAEVQQQSIEAGESDGRCRRRRVRRSHRVMPTRAQHSQERLAARRIALEHQQMHRGHVFKLQPNADVRQPEPP